MRLRNVKNADEIISSSPYIISKPNSYKGTWQQILGNNNPIHIEIGMGKGRFIRENAVKYPNINFIGIEKYSSVMARAIQRLGTQEIPNLKLICLDALNIVDVFDHEIDVLYLNFSDPWPKDRHARRRLTSEIFLELYENIFKDYKKIVQKTDNYNLFEYSKERFTNHNYDIKISDFDIEHMSLDNIMTEYEERFLTKGNTIYKIDAFKK